MKALILAIRFVLELCGLAAFAYWGSRTGGSTAANVALAISAPLVAAAIWGRYLAPKSKRRLPERRRIPLEIVFFGLATAALADAGATTAAIVFGVVAAVNTTLVHLQPEI